MIYLYSFLFCGFVCAISQYVLEKSKLTPGHINTSLVIIGCILSGFGIYDKLINNIPVKEKDVLITKNKNRIKETHNIFCCQIFILANNSIFNTSNFTIGISIITH